jgi:hypothetical protein
MSPITDVLRLWTHLFDCIRDLDAATYATIAPCFQWSSDSV